MRAMAEGSMRTSSSRSWLWILLLLLIAAAVWWLMRGRGAGEGEIDPARGENPRLLLDRVWVDSKPQKHTDYMQVMIALSDAPIGAFQKASAYRAELEIFEFKRDGARVDLVFPQSNSKKRFSYTIEKCDDLPPFDLCLTLNDNPWKGAPRRYYGASEGGDEARALGDLRHRLLHDLRQAD
jgi:hypothetical protein